MAGTRAVALRPKFYWDRNSRVTGLEQFVKAVTSTVEHKFPYQRTNTVVQLENRYDELTDVGGWVLQEGRDPSWRVQAHTISVSVVAQCALDLRVTVSDHSGAAARLSSGAVPPLSAC